MHFSIVGNKILLKLRGMVEDLSHENLSAIRGLLSVIYIVIRCLCTMTVFMNNS